MRCLEILVVDDNPGEALLVAEFFQANCGANVSITHDGEEALELVLRHGYTPDLMVLDLDLPNLIGQQILVNVRRKIAIPIVVMSSSPSYDDVSLAYATGANVYMTKPSGFEAFRKMLQVLAQLWIEPLMRLSEASTDQCPTSASAK